MIEYLLIGIFGMGMGLYLGYSIGKSPTHHRAIVSETPDTDPRGVGGSSKRE